MQTFEVLQTPHFCQFQTSYRSPHRQNTQISKITHSVFTFDWWRVLISHPAVERCHVFRSALFLLLCFCFVCSFYAFSFIFFLLVLSCIWQRIEYFLTYGPLKACRRAHMGLFSQSTGCQ